MRKGVMGPVVDWKPVRTSPMKFSQVKWGKAVDRPAQLYSHSWASGSTSCSGVVAVGQCGQAHELQGQDLGYRSMEWPLLNCL